MRAHVIGPLVLLPCGEPKAAWTDALARKVVFPLTNRKIPSSLLVHIPSQPQIMLDVTSIGIWKEPRMKTEFIITSRVGLPGILLSKIRAGIIGVGNCASGIIQGIE